MTLFYCNGAPQFVQNLAVSSCSDPQLGQYFLPGIPSAGAGVPSTGDAGATGAGADALLPSILIISAFGSKLPFLSCTNLTIA